MKNLLFSATGILTVAGLSTMPASLLAKESCEHDLDAPVTEVRTKERTFVAGGMVVIVNDATKIEFDNGGRASFEDIKAGRVVEIDGHKTEAGWVACEVEIRPKKLLSRGGWHGVEAIIESIDLDAGVMVVGGVTVQIVDSTKLEDERDRKITLDQFVVGEEVEVKGRFNKDSVLVAREIEK